MQFHTPHPPKKFSPLELLEHNLLCSQRNQRAAVFNLQNLHKSLCDLSCQMAEIGQWPRVEKYDALWPFAFTCLIKFWFSRRWWATLPVVCEKVFIKSERIFRYSATQDVNLCLQPLLPCQYLSSVHCDKQQVAQIWLQFLAFIFSNKKKNKWYLSISPHLVSSSAAAVAFVSNPAEGKAEVQTIKAAVF